MRFLLAILFLSVSYCYSQAQIAKVKGVSITGKDALYSPTAMPITTQAATKFKNHSDSLKTLYALVKDLGNMLTIANKVAKHADSISTYLTKRNKILTDSLSLTYKQASIIDSTFWKPGNIKGKGTRLDPSEIICPCK